MYHICQHAHIDLIDYVLSKKIDSPYTPMRAALSAAKENMYHDLVDLLVSRGAVLTKEYITETRNYGHHWMAEYLEKKYQIK
jgi:hypothetical protein